MIVERMCQYLEFILTFSQNEKYYDIQVLLYNLYHSETYNYECIYDKVDVDL